VELFAMIGEDVPVATRALLSGNSEMVPVLAEREQVIDALYREIEGLAVRAILLQAPVASDLRFLLSVLRVAPELERSHDLVMQIASRAGRIRGEDLSPHSRGLVERTGELASGMWREAADSWYERDRAAVSALGERERARRQHRAPGGLPRRPRSRLALAGDAGLLTQPQARSAFAGGRFPRPAGPRPGGCGWTRCAGPGQAW
jgi:phosphate uptake regulator